MTTIFVDGRPLTVQPGQNALQACLGMGFDLPYFCWHPAMGSVGACRQCAVKQFRDENDTNGRIVMACMTPASEGLRISIDDPEAHEFRASITEWMMLNHPHDCPVCDEGGECHLQDMVVMTGHNYRSYRGNKRTFHNQDLGPFINHEMNRCIQCYRCVRFYNDYAGGTDFGAFRLRNIVYFGRQHDGTLESGFSGNLVEVCPTGVFDDKTLKQHYTRKWDLQTAPSVCVHCSVGCNTIPGERYGLLRRIRNRYNSAVNGYFLCDRGRYGYEFVNSDRRVREPLIRVGPGASLVPVTKEAALERARSLVANGRTIGIGSPRASVETNFALRAIVGPDRFYAGVSDAEWDALVAVRDTLRESPAAAASLAGVGASDAVLVLGEDVTNTAPMIALQLRQAVRNQPMRRADAMHVPRWDDYNVRELLQGEHGPLWIASPFPTALDEIATETFLAAPDDIARFGMAVAHAIDASAPAVDGLAPAIADQAVSVAKSLMAAQAPLVLSGASLGSPAVIQAAGAVARALCRLGHPAKLCLAVPECNSIGLALMADRGLGAALAAIEAGDAGAVLVVENDLARRLGEDRLQSALGNVSVVAIDSLSTPTTELAEAVLPAATFAEGDGTFVNNEGRAQRFFQAFPPTDGIWESWRWLRELALPDRPAFDGWTDLDAVIGDVSRALPEFAPIADAAPSASFRIAEQRVARQPHRYSGRTSMTANINVNEAPPPHDHDSPLSFSMEGFQNEPPAALVPRFWSPGWNSVQALNKYQEEIAGPLRGGDPGQRLAVLTEPAAFDGGAYPAAAPLAFVRREKEWLAVPMHHMFGSEELSSVAGAAASRAQAPYVALNRDDASQLSLTEGDPLVVTSGEGAYQLPLRIVSLPPGLVGIGAGLPGGPPFHATAWVSIAPLGPLDG